MIICEIGLNHMGSVKYANEYVDKIIKTGADGIIFHIRESSFYKNNKKIIDRHFAPRDFAKAVDREAERIAFNNMLHEERLRKYVRGYTK